MAFEVVDRDERLVRGKRQPLPGEQRNHHSADQPRPLVVAIPSISAIEVPASDSTRRTRSGRISTCACCDFRNHATLKVMRGVLADHGLREDATIARHQRHRAVIAG